MDFHRYISNYERMKQLKFLDPTYPYEKFYKELLGESPNIVAQGDLLDRWRAISSVNQTMAEMHWYDDRKPYYKVWPGMIDTFTLIPLDIPAKHLRAPYRAFSIYLPAEPILDFAWEGRQYWAKTLFCYYSQSEFDPKTGQSELSPGLTVWMDFGEQDAGFNVYSYAHSKFREGLTIEQAFAEEEPDNKSIAQGVQVPEGILNACIRLAVSVCFVATGSQKILDRDIVKKHLESYRREPEASPNRKRWEDKSQRLGLGGWHIGRDKAERGLKLERGQTYEQALSTGEARKFLYQHQRGAHWRRIPVGPGGKERIPHYFIETTVRPDLPPKPIKR